MKRPSILALLILTLSIALMIGCDNGSVSGPAAEKSSGLVKVCLTVDGDSGMAQKSVSVSSDINWASLTFQYNAVPQWNGTNIQGATSWTALPAAYSDNMSLGYFTPGQWVFGIRLLKGGTVLYEGFSSVTSISNTSVSVAVTVHKLIREVYAGSVRISVTAPTMQGENLSLSYTGDATGGPYTANKSSLNGITTFEYTVPDLEAGSYSFTLSHPASGSGAAVAIDLREGEMAVISGHLDNGIWQVGYITVNIHSVSINKNEYGLAYLNNDFAAVDDKVSFTLNPLSGSSVQSLNISYVENEVTKYVSYTTNGNLYSFYMPDYDVTINVVFRAVDLDITIAFFKSIVQGIYDENEATSFGRSDTPPEDDYFAIKDVRVWLNGTKICWYSPNGNTFKFKPGSLKNFFKDCDKLVSIDLRGIDTSEVTNMASLFENCYDLKSVNLSGINTEKVTDMSRMFYHAGYHYFPVYETGTPREDQTHNHQDNSENLVISNMNFNTGKVLNMSYMFSVCAAVDLSGTNMSSWDVSKCTDFSYMFAGESINKSGYKYWYNKIASFNISSWNTISATTFRNMFALCNRFTEIDISGWKFDNVVYVDRMFERCECLGRVDTQGNAADNNKVIFPAITKLTKVQDMLYWFGKDVEFRRENLKTIVESWDFTGNPYADSLFAVDTNSDTSPETIPSNRILAYECLSNTSANYRQNFKTVTSATTIDGRTLYFGGSGVKGQRIRSVQ